MTRDEYERSKARIEEQHRAAVELMETACKAQLRALELVWLVQGEGGAGSAAAIVAATPAAPASAKQESSPPPPPPRRKTSPEVANDITKVCYWRLPETFTRNDVLEILDYEPDRATLSRSLQTLVEKKFIRIEEEGAGHRPTIYRRTPPPKQEPDASS
jgi:hypothetical protein